MSRHSALSGTPHLHADNAERPTTRRLSTKSIIAGVATSAVSAGSIVAFLASGNASATTVDWQLTRNALDTFTRVVHPGFGTAPQGGAWHSSASSIYSSVFSDTGHIAAPAGGHTNTFALTGVHNGDERARLTFDLTGMPNGAGGEYVTVRSRVQPDGSAMGATIHVVPSGAASIALTEMTAHGVMVIGAARVPFTVHPNQALNLELQTTGVTPVVASARVYLAGLTAPNWQVSRSATNSRRVTHAGSVGLSVSTAPGTAGAGVLVHSISGWALSAPVTNPVPPVPTQTASATPSPTSTPTSPAPSSTPTSPAPSGEPGPTNTGVPAGTHLTVVNGDLTITRAGTVLSGLDIHGNVNIAAPDVVLKNSIVRGGAMPTHGHCIVEDNMAGNGKNFLIEDTELAPTNINYYQNDICGANFTALRINSHSGVDTMDIAGSNVTVKDSWLHDTTAFAYSPEHSNGTHNDGIEITIGSNILIEHNVIRGGGNSAIQIKQDQGVTHNVNMTGNWFDGGTCSLHINDAPKVGMTGITVSGNTFTNDATIKNCAGVVTHTVTLSWSGNKWTSGSNAPVIVYG